MATEQPRILIIDDDPLFHGLIGGTAEMLGYTWQAANNLNEAMLALREAETHETPFAVVTIDMKFEMGKGGEQVLLGKTILRQIKAAYPNIACIIISGSGVPAHEVLNMRDDYGLDYYISKDRLEPETLDRGIKRALERIRPLKNTEVRRVKLEKALEKYKDICAIYVHNLAQMEEKKAQKGIDVSVDIENQIELYQEKLQAAQHKVKVLTVEIQQLGSD